MWAIQQKEKCYGKFSQRTKIEQTFDGFLSFFLMNERNILKNSANLKKLNKRNESKDTLATGVHIFVFNIKLSLFKPLGYDRKRIAEEKN